MRRGQRHGLSAPSIALKPAVVVLSGGQTCPGVCIRSHRFPRPRRPWSRPLSPKAICLWSCGRSWARAMSRISWPISMPTVSLGVTSVLACTYECDDVSLSRLSHGQPGVQAHPEIVQGTAELHHEIADARLPQPDPVFHNATTLHTAVDMLNPQSAVVEHLVGQVLLQGQFLTAGLLRRHEDRRLRERERQE